MQHTAILLLKALLLAGVVAATANVAPAQEYANSSLDGSGSPHDVAGSNTRTLSALLAFKHAISIDPTAFLATWNTSLVPNYCNWRGVQCAHGTRDVIALSLESKQLHGTLSPHLKHLSQLSHLNVSHNSFHSHIPPELGELSSLTHLDLSVNQFTGSIPVTLANCTRLQILELGINALSGKFPSFLPRLSHLTGLDISENSFPGEVLPPDIGRLSNLRFLQFYHSDLSGSIPPSIGNCTSLVLLELSKNNLAGSLPSEWSKLSSIQYIFLSDNFFTGRIPATLGNCTTLVQLSLNNNSFTAELPESLGKLAMLQYLGLLSNRISGAIPRALMNCSGLLSLQLANNQLTGPLPSSVGQLKQVEQLSFSNNSKLSGRIPATIGDCVQLTTLKIRFTEVGAQLPISVFNLSNLQTLWLSSSKFSGSLSDDLTNLTALIDLRLDGNAFVGRLPARLGEMTALQGLSLHHNNFEGPIPQVLQFNSMSSIDLSFNLFSGEVPAALGQLHLLSDLYLQNNFLSGGIPDVFKSLTGLLNLDFSHNQLTGTVPHSLSVRESLDLSSNNLTGFIPPLMGSMRMVATIKLARNHLTGGIPDSLGGCQNLQALDLSVNNLSGEIPSTFGLLVLLQSLDLSHNRLRGALPQSLGGLQNLVTVNVSYNALQGRIPSVGIYHRSPAAAFMGNPELCGYPLDRSCSSGFFHKSRRDRTVLMASLCSIAGVLMIFACICYLGRRRSCLSLSVRKRHPLDLQSQELTPVSMRNLELKAWTAGELREATNGFDLANLVGSGGGSVCFKGMLAEAAGAKKLVAIKRLDMASGNGREAQTSFAQELEALCQVRHRNLVRILGYCKDEGVVALVLEFMEKGSLYEHLQSETKSLSWAQRLSIATDVAEGLVYLHHEFHQPIVHCDLKPANILLGENMVAKIADFGIAKVLEGSQRGDSVSTSNFRGTFGYAAPECASGWRISTKVDVYSYGVVLIELLTGMKPSSPYLQEKGINLHTWATQVLKSGCLEDILFKIALQQNILEQDVAVLQQLEELLDVAARCTNEIPQKRPTIKNVRQILFKFSKPAFCCHNNLEVDALLWGRF